MNEKKLLNELKKKFGAVSITPCVGGLVNRVYHVKMPNNQSVIKIARAKSRWKSLKDPAIMKHFADNIKTPNFINSFDVYLDEKYSITQMSFLDGEIGCTAPEELPTEFFREAGRTLADFHSLKYDQFGFLVDMNTVVFDPRVNNSFGGPYDNSFDQFYVPCWGWCNHLIGKGSRFSENLSKVIEKMGKYAPAFDEVEPHLNHGDFVLKNTMHKDGTMSGLFDFDSVRAGDRSYDLHLFCYDCHELGVHPDNINAFLKSYDDAKGLPKHMPEKGEYYRCFKGIQRAITIWFELAKIPDRVHRLHKDELNHLLEDIAVSQTPYYGEHYGI